MTAPGVLTWSTHADLAINRRPSVPRAEYLDHMTFRASLRPLFTEIFGPMIGLKEEWAAQGATPEELDFSAFRYRCEARFQIPVNTGRLGQTPAMVLEENADHTLLRDDLGRTLKLSRGVATLPLPLDYPVRTMDDWLAIKPRYAFDPSRLDGDWEEAARRALAADAVICAGMPGGFDEPRELMGEENLCVACYEQPELIHDMLDTLGRMAEQVWDAVTRRVKVDVLFAHEDMAGKSGPLFGPRQVREFMLPYYRRVWDLLEGRGARLFDVDSDGNIDPIIPDLLDAGVNCLHPMEPAAGMDVVRVRERHGRRLAFYGGLDKHVLRQSPADIDAELARKLPPLLDSGGCVPALDHRVPNGTPLAHYRHYVRRVWEYLD